MKCSQRSKYYQLVIKSEFFVKENQHSQPLIYTVLEAYMTHFKPRKFQLESINFKWKFSLSF